MGVLGTVIENQIVYFGTDSIRKYNLKDVKHKLFFYFSGNTCSPCIDQTVDIIEEHFPDYKNDNEIIFIAANYEARIRNNIYGKRVMTLTNNLGLNTDTIALPLVFTLDSLKVDKFHIVNKLDFPKTDSFLKMLSTLVQQKEITSGDQ